MSSLFPTLTDDARLWIWVADRPLSKSEQASVKAAVDGFIEGWTSHGRRIQGAASIFLDQVLVLAAEIREAEISGCGIDTSVHLLERISHEQGFRWSSALDVPLVVDGTDRLSVVTRGTLRAEAANGELSPEAMIVDRTLTRLGELRNGGLKRRARESWASRYFLSGSASEG